MIYLAPPEVAAAPPVAPTFFIGTISVANESGASVIFDTDGMIRTGSIPIADLYPWMDPAADPSLYEIKCVVSGAGLYEIGFSSDVTNTWLSLGTTRVWQIYSPPPAFKPKNTTLSLSIRRASDGVIVATGTANLAVGEGVLV